MDLDDGGDAVLLDPGDDPGEPVARGLGDDRAVGRGAAALREEPGDLRDVTMRWLPSCVHAQPALGLPAPERFDGDAQHLGGLADAQAGVIGSCCSGHTAEVSAV